MVRVHPPLPPAPWSLRALFFVLGLWTASLAPFIPVILRGRGFDPAAIGLVSAAAALAAIVIVPALGHVADVVVGRARTFRVGLIAAAVAAVAVLLPLPPLVIAACLGSFWLFFGAFNSLGDALATEALSAPERQYGSLRALSSLSFAIGVVAVGLVYDRVGYGGASVVALGWSAALFLLLGRVADRSRDPAFRRLASSHGGSSAAGRFGSVSRAFAVQPRLWAVLTVLTLAYIGLQGALTFVGVRIVELGGQPSDVALTFGVSALAEVPGLVVAGWLGRRIGLRWLTTLALVGFGLCIASWGVLPSPIAINTTRFMTGLCFGAFTAARVLLIARLLPAPLQATGQGLIQAATIGIGSVLGSITGGLEYGWLGPTGFFLVAGMFTVIGGVGALVVLGGPVGARERAEPDAVA